MSKKSNFRSLLTSLWFRLCTLGIVGLVFAEALLLAPGKAQGWTFYLTASEVAFEVVVRLVFAALAGMALGTVCTAAIAPILWLLKSARARVADWTTKVAVILVVFLVSRLALKILIKWSYSLSAHRALYDKGLFAAFYLAFALALFIPRASNEVVTSLDGFLNEKMTRRTALATVAGTAALVVTEYVLSKSMPAVRAAFTAPRPKSNFLLITFDALTPRTCPSMDADIRLRQTLMRLLARVRSLRVISLHRPLPLRAWRR